MKVKNKKSIILLIIMSFIFFLVSILVYIIVSGDFSLKSLMGNSVTGGFYYCEDNTYTLDGEKCVKNSITDASLLGDVNGDGVVDNNDIDTLSGYLAKTVTIQEERLVAGDVNSDGVISVGDVENIRLYVEGHNTGESYLSKIGSSYVCPKDYELSNNTCYKEESIKAKMANNKKGDINLDGSVNIEDIKLLNKYLKKQVNLTTLQLSIADYNENGVVDINDLNNLEKDLNEKQKKINTMGDINLDGIINSNDVLLLEKYVNKMIKLKDEELEVSDIDENGTVDSEDLKALALKISSFYQKGDINENGYVDQNDLTLLQNYVNNIVSLTEDQKILADVDDNDVIDNNDCNTLRGKISKTSKYKIGDVNMDGLVRDDDITIIEEYILNNIDLSIEQKTLADYNKDGSVDNNDANSLANNVASKYKIGDINMDGKKNILDMLLLKDHISGVKKLNTVQKLLADINGDGKIDANDLV